jgi:hypothetical protein
MTLKDLFLVFGPIVAAGFVGMMFRRSEDQRRDAGQRVGSLERSRDYWQGWFDCWREHRRGSNDR